MAEKTEKRSFRDRLASTSIGSKIFYSDADLREKEGEVDGDQPDVAEEAQASTRAPAKRPAPAPPSSRRAAAPRPSNGAASNSSDPTAALLRAIGGAPSAVPSDTADDAASGESVNHAAEVTIDPRFQKMIGDIVDAASTPQWTTFQRLRAKMSRHVKEEEACYRAAMDAADDVTYPNLAQAVTARREALEGAKRNFDQQVDVQTTAAVDGLLEKQKSLQERQASLEAEIARLQGELSSAQSEAAGVDGEIARVRGHFENASAGFAAAYEAARDELEEEAGRIERYLKQV